MTLTDRLRAGTAARDDMAAAADALEWQPIATAPKDGTLICIGWKFPEDTRMQEWFTMQWAHTQRNGLFPGKVGMWTTPGGGMTWNDDGDGGPTHWKPLSEAPQATERAQVAVPGGRGAESEYGACSAKNEGSE